MFKDVDNKIDFPRMEEEIQRFWEEKKIFQKSIDNRAGEEEFVFYDGPPFATGLPHFGHFVPSTIKDIIPRYKTMKGMQVHRRFGWDCHGLPVEYEMEKELGISGKKQIEEYGVAKFNEACRSIVLRFTDQWEKIISRLGRWVDFENDYKTMDPPYMESIWWVVKQLWEKDLVYEGHYILPYCARCSTVLSNHELNLGGYKDVHDPAITVRFALKEDPSTSILAWTTTPWTLPSNLALAVHPEIDYVKVKDGEDFFILAEERLSAYYRDPGEYEIVSTFKGRELLNKEYEALFPYFEDLRETGAFRVFPADYVSTEDGTGVVHTAPGFGEDDYNTLKDTDIPTICPVDEEGCFTEKVRDYAGIFVKEADKQIIKDLKEAGKLIKRDNYLHAYPHCWRCKSPLIYRAVSSWFVKVEQIKEKLLKANQNINWVPSHLQEGRFGKWLEGARDWAISRNRYWGNPIPIWRCQNKDCDSMECIGSIKELQEKSGKRVEDLHKHFVDDIEIDCPNCSSKMRRVPEVLDCWFESGSMPYAQNHYPMENKDFFERNFPADFIAEGLDQTRGWFYTLTILAAALFDKPAFENVVVNGLVLAEDGKKMSKSERNYTDPMEVINQFGADALRLFLINSAVVRGEDLRYSDEGVKEILKSVIIPLWNAYSFFITYANIDQVKITGKIDNLNNPLDRWIISEMEKLCENVTLALDQYELQKALGPILGFIDSLNNWYIRRSRRRFWKSGNDQDKQQAYESLYYVMLKLVKIAAPFIPFTSEEIFQNLSQAKAEESVHLCRYPEAKKKNRDLGLEKKMEISRQTVSMGRHLRAIHQIKNRQPLKSIYLVTIDKEEKNILREMEELVREELNVKEVIFRENEEELVEYSAKANFKVLGKMLGKDMKQAASRINQLSSSEIQSILNGGVLSLEINGKQIDLNQENIIINRQEKSGLKVLNEDSLTIALDTQMSRELKEEGLVRDLIRGIQNLRKEMDFDVQDRIILWFSGPQEIHSAVENFSDYLKNETLSLNWEWKESPEPAASELETEMGNCQVIIQKAK